MPKKTRSTVRFKKGTKKKIRDNTYLTDDLIVNEVLKAVDDETGKRVVNVSRSSWDRSGKGVSPKTMGLLLKAFEFYAERRGLAVFVTPDDVESVPDEDRDAGHEQTAALIWNVPYAENRFFVGRDDVIDAIHERLNGNGTAVLGQAVVHGLGGIGKTETAIAYAYKYKNDYRHVFWVRCDAKLQIQSAFLELHQLMFPEADASFGDDLIHEIRRWFRSNEKWLLIFDNADDPAVLPPLLPDMSNGHVIVTSRANSFRATLGIADPIKLSVLSIDDAVLFLLSSTGRNTIATEQKRFAAREIAIELGQLPLALEWAASYVAKMDASFVDYVKSLRRMPIPTLAKGDTALRGYKKTVLQAWCINLQSVQRASPESAMLLYILSFYEPDEVPYELLLFGASELPSELKSILAEGLDDPLVISELLRPLVEFSLVDVNAQLRAVTAHRVVLQVARHSMMSAEHRTLAIHATMAVCEAFPPACEKTWRSCARMLSHAVATTYHVEQLKLENVHTARLYERIGDFLVFVGRSDEAVAPYKQALNLFRNWSEDNTGVAESLVKLGAAYQSISRLDDAEQTVREGVELYRRCVNLMHPGLQESILRLAHLCLMLGRYGESEQLFKEVFDFCPSRILPAAIHSEVMGERENTPRFRVAMTGLANIYHATGRYKQAEILFEKAIALNKGVNTNSLELAKTLADFARLHQSMKRFDSAQTLFEQSVDTVYSVVGEEHYRLADALHTIAVFCCQLKRYEDAERYLNRAVGITRMSLGEHRVEFRSCGRMPGELVSQNGEERGGKEAYINGRSPRTGLLREVTKTLSTIF